MPITEADIRRGLEQREFFPAFQPLVELRTGKLAGFEVLARWEPVGVDAIPPTEFIPAIEKARLIDGLTTSILSQAFASDLISKSLLMLAFNLSTTQLLDHELPVRLEALAHRYNFPLDRLTIEITESALVDDLDRAATVAQSLKALHCRLALDDFGTGYSSLKHLHALPFDELKVDRSFVISMATRRESRKIVASVIGLGQSLGLLTVAEGVETREQAEMLFWLGCDLGQGWWFGKPALLEELPNVIDQPLWAHPIVSPRQEDSETVISLEAVPTHRLAQLQAIYDGAPVGLCFLDRNLRYVSLNQRLARMNNVPAAAHLGRCVSEVIPDLFPLVEPYLNRALKGEALSGVEFVKPPKGTRTDSETIVASYQPVRDETGDVLGVSVAITDVTQRKRTEQALKESEDRYRRIMRLSPNVPWILDSRGEVIDASPRWEEMTGQPMEKAMGNGWMEVLHPDDVQPTIEAIQNSIRTGLPIDIHYRIRHPGQEWKWMRSRGTPRFSALGEIDSIYGVVEEMDGHQQLSDELIRCEAELRAAIDVVPEGIIIAKAIFESSVFPGQKLAEYGLMGVLTADGRALLPNEHPLYRAIQRGEEIEFQPFTHRRSDGTYSTIALASRPVRSDEGRLVGAIMMIRDSVAA
jgi:PAS domain S-box-containing protein